MFWEAPACCGACGEASMHITVLPMFNLYLLCLPADVKAPTHPDGAVPDLHQAQCISKYFDGFKYEGMLFNKTTPYPFLFFYLFLTVCHPVIGGNPSCIA